MRIIVSIPYRLATNNLGIKRSTELYNCFNSLQVSYKLIRLIRIKSLFIWFQFLIGQLQTENWDGTGQTAIIVSIPYRLATNKQMRYKLFSLLSRFQFLIGQLQTKVLNIINGTVSAMFQFLIGQLQTRGSFSQRQALQPGFNSLQVSYKPILYLL